MGHDEHLRTWGTPRHPVSLDRAAGTFLREQVGSASPWRAQPAHSLTPARLTAEDLAPLAAIVGESHVQVDDGARLAATGGASYLDWARHRAGDRSDVPDAVIRPGSAEEVVAVLAAAQDRGIRVVPIGGGTSVVGGLREDRPHVALVLDRLGVLLNVDEVSHLAVVGPAATGPRLEPLLAARGLTLGHIPQSWARASIGGYVATRSAGQASTGYGRIDDMVEALTVATPQGLLRLGRGPSSAAGPDLRSLFIGSEGTLGVITDVTLRVRPLPTQRRYEAVVFPSFAAGVSAFRSIAQGRVTADVMRLSDEAETRTTLALSGPSGAAAAALRRYLRARGVDVTRASLAILGWEGTDGAYVVDRRRAAWRILKDHGAIALGRRAGESWRRGRLDGPFLRDALMDAGYLVETLETAIDWRGYLDLHENLTRAIEDSLVSAYVMSHVSHVYETGASLYTTVIAVADQADPVAQWTLAKNAAMQVIVDSGATVTHHHGVGRDHASWLADEWGALGLEVLASAKRAVDPHGVLNPGVLLPEDRP